MADTKTTKTNSAGVRRRDFLATGAVALAVGVTGFPAILRAQAASVKIGLIHPVSGFIAFSGSQCRAGAEMAIADINAAGGIKSMIFGGEGLFFATLTGPGHVWLQSLPFSRLAGRIFASLPSRGGSKGEGSILGGLGNLLDGDNF